MLLAEFYDSQIPVLRGKVKPATWAAYTAAWRHRVHPTLGHLDLDQIGPFEIENAYYTWTGSFSTRQDAIALLSQLFRRAVRARLVSTSPMGSLDLPKASEADPVARALTSAEWHNLIARVDNAVYRDPLVLLHATGLRWSEMAGLTPASIDPERALLHVHNQFAPGTGGRRQWQSTKSGKPRTVPIEGLQDLLTRAAERSKNVGSPFLFSGPRGGALVGKNVSRALRFHAWREEIKSFPPGQEPLHWHDLRHTAATNFFRAGIPAPVIQKIMGHASLAVTQMYARANDDDILRAGTQLNGWSRGVTK